MTASSDFDLPVQLRIAPWSGELTEWRREIERRLAESAARRARAAVIRERTYRTPVPEKPRPAPRPRREERRASTRIPKYVQIATPELCNRYLSGEMLVTLAADLGCSDDTVKAALTYMGVTTPTRPRPRHKKELDHELIARLRKLYEEDLYSMKDIEKETGVSRSRVTRLFTHAGVPIRNGVTLRSEYAARGVKQSDVRRWCLETGRPVSATAGYPALRYLKEYLDVHARR